MARASTGKCRWWLGRTDEVACVEQFFSSLSCSLDYRNGSKQALTNDLIEGLEKDLERLKRFEENLRIRKLRTMKGGDKIINETDEDRHN